MASTEFLEEPRLSRDEITDLFQKMDGIVNVVDIQEKGTIVSAGDLRSTIYVVVKGEVVVDVPLKDRWVTVAWLTEGSVIGELSFFDRGPRAARVLARTTCRLYCIEREAFQDFALKWPSDSMRFVWRLAEIMAYRLRRIEQFDAIEHGRSEERKGIAADLHDQTMNDLSGILMYLGLLKVTASNTNVEMVSEIEFIGSMVKLADKKLRSIVKGMAQDSVTRLGLVKAIEAHFEDISSNPVPHGATLRVKLLCEGFDNSKLPEAVAVDLFNIIHQAVANAVAHSRAQVITVRLLWLANELKFEIQDDGVGFDRNGISNTAATGHFGLLNLKLRAERMSGSLVLDSNPGRGTQISGTIPIANDGADLSSKVVASYEFGA